MRFDNLSDRMEEVLRAVQCLDRKLFHGNGQPPIIVRMDRLEQAELAGQRRLDRLRTAVAAVIVFLSGQWIWGWVSDLWMKAKP